VPILSWEQVAAVAIKAGWSPGAAVIAVSITEPESARDSTVIQQGEPYATTGWGLWQITPGDSEPQFGVNEAMLNPLSNARAALAKYNGAGGFSPWTTWSAGKNVPYIPEAEAAVAAVTHLKPGELDKLVKQAEAGAGGTGGIVPPATDWAYQIRLTRGHLHRATLDLAAAADATRRIRPRLRPPAVIPPGPAGIVAPIERTR
jgi:hypothetical protein